ncbi:MULTISPECIES: ferrous iron transport protein A [Clostridium]|uniref:Ferrous iron transport protein A n=1 Tax=Clostridium senegalense TaxID=1465809 RepID=A0A6M0H2Y7_9CLOT|nr:MULTISPECIES: ferrous iron transport protein A [Clostridium]NEU04897.1 ferrous iron transport protein A [Clostridium senegalense]
MTLQDLKPGDIGFIKNIHCDKKLSKRLLALGFVEGTKVLMKQTAPLGDPIIINVRGTNLAIRKKDAKTIDIDLNNNSNEEKFKLAMEV